MFDVLVMAVTSGLRGGRAGNPANNFRTNRGVVFAPVDQASTWPYSDIRWYVPDMFSAFIAAMRTVWIVLAAAA